MSMHAIELKNVSFSYPGGFSAVEGVSMSFSPGESVAIIGQNGAGKTTTVKLMNNLYQPTSGEVLVFGESTTGRTTAQVARKVGYVFQNPDDQIFQPTVGKEIAYAPKATGVPEEESKQKIDFAVELCGLRGALEENPYDLPLSIRKFVTIACVIAADPEVLIFDEPTAGQDLGGLELLSHLIEEMTVRGKTVITITHDMDFVLENFRRVVVMANKKKIADGPADEIFWNDAVMREASLNQPPLCRLAAELGLPRGIVAQGEFFEAIARNRAITNTTDK